MRTSRLIVEAPIEEEISRLLTLLLSDIASFEGMDIFLKAFLSKRELEVFNKRLAVIYWLHRGKRYQDIKNDLKVSSATIAHAQEILEKNNLSEFFKILDANEWAEKMSKKIKTMVSGG